MDRSTERVPRRRQPHLPSRRSAVGPARRSLARDLTTALLLGVLFYVFLLVYRVTCYGKLCDSDKFCLFPSPDDTDTTSGGIKIGTTSFDVAWNPDRAANFYHLAFRSLIVQGFLSRGWRSLCVGSRAGDMVSALKGVGVEDAVGAGRRDSPPFVAAGDPLHQPLGDETFDFVFADVGVVEGSLRQGDLVAELQRTLKPRGFIVVHTSSAGDTYSLHSLLDLLPSCTLVRSREIAGFGSVPVVREIALQKEEEGRRGTDILGSKGKEMQGASLSSDDKSKSFGCLMPQYKRELPKFAEPLIDEEPKQPWITLKSDAQNVTYLPSMADISFKRNYVYIDVGARNYRSSIGNWFRERYPKQSRTFEIFAMGADAAFHSEHAAAEGIKSIPFAAWVRNETLSFEVSQNPDDHDNEGEGLAMGRISRASSGSSNHGDVQSVQGIDFAEWLMNTVSETDFVVMEMDVEGAEFDLIPRLYETGALCLVDEMFLKCRYNQWQKRSPKHRRTYRQCFKLVAYLRSLGVVAHQWW